MQMVTTCSSLQTFYTAPVVKLCLELLLHEDITVRRAALRLMLFILKQYKPELKKVEVDPYEMAGCERPKKRTPGKIYILKTETSGNPRGFFMLNYFQTDFKFDVHRYFRELFNQSYFLLIL